MDATDPDSARVAFTHNLLRVLEAVRVGEGEAAVGTLYEEYGRRIHHDRTFAFTAEEALQAVGLPPKYGSAFDDASWDAVLVDAMNEGLALCGDDVGTPIIAFDDSEGTRVGLFGPVISRQLSSEDALLLWDAFITMARVPGFWEAKRTRTERPQFGPRP